MEICNECCSGEHDEPMPQAIEHDANDPVTQDAILVAVAEIGDAVAAKVVPGTADLFGIHQAIGNIQSPDFVPAPGEDPVVLEHGETVIDPVVEQRPGCAGV